VALHGKPWELYDLSRDRSEQHDLSGTEPERVSRMAAMWEAYAARANVAPWDEVTRKPR
jgi:arylsulfatase